MGAESKGESSGQGEGKWNQEEKGGQKVQGLWPEMRDEAAAARQGRSACAVFLGEKDPLHGMSSGEESQLSPHIEILKNHFGSFMKNQGKGWVWRGQLVITAVVQREVRACHGVMVKKML